MLEKLKKKSQLFLRISIFKFIYFNFLCTKIKRKRGCYLLPYKNVRMSLGQGSCIELNANLCLGINQLPGAKAETFIRLAPGAKWLIEGNSYIYYNVHVELHENAKLKTGSMVMNCGGVIVCRKSILLGNHVMMGRDVTIYDSNHHDMISETGEKLNSTKEVIIEDDVWLTGSVRVLKGANIRNSSIVGAYSVLNKEYPEKSFIAGTPAKVIKEAYKWIWDYE